MVGDRVAAPGPGVVRREGQAGAGVAPEPAPRVGQRVQHPAVSPERVAVVVLAVVTEGTTAIAVVIGAGTGSGGATHYVASGLIALKMYL